MTHCWDMSVSGSRLTLNPATDLPTTYIADNKAKLQGRALAGVAQLGIIQQTKSSWVWFLGRSLLGWGFCTQLGHLREATNWCFSLTLVFFSISFPLPFPSRPFPSLPSSLSPPPKKNPLKKTSRKNFNWLRSHSQKLTIIKPESQNHEKNGLFGSLGWG